MSKNALVIIDIQNCFINKETKNLSEKLVNFINKNKSNFNFVLFTKFINQKSSNFFKILKWKKCLNSPETDIVGELSKFVNENYLFKKSSYSIFKSREFVNFLDKNDIDKLFLCGVDIDGCILASVFDGFDLGYDIKIIEDLCYSSSGKELNKAALKIIRRNLQK